MMRHKPFLQKSKNTIRVTLVYAVILMTGALLNPAFSQNDNWVAPTDADTYENPYKGNEYATLAGKKLYAQYCAVCHGKKGKGDGVAGMALDPRPTNLMNDAVEQQSDGAIYWKITEGRTPMATYKDILTDQERWQLVSFIRSLHK